MSSPPEKVLSRRSRSSSANAEAADDRGGPVAPGVAAGVLEPGLRLGVAAEGRLVVSHPRPSPPRGAASSVSIATRSVAPERTYSRSVRSRSRGGRWSCSATRVPFANASFPPCDLGLAREQAQEGRLPGAVRPGERDAIPALDLERDAVEERVARESLRRFGGDEDGHAHMVAATGRRRLRVVVRWPPTSCARTAAAIAAASMPGCGEELGRGPGGRHLSRREE